jgi:CBS domain-containing protein
MTTIAEILKAKGTEVISVGPEDSAASVVGILTQHRIGAVLVRDPAGEVLGILSERDIVRGLANSGAAALDKTARDLMTQVLHTVTPRASVVQAMSMITDRRVRHLPVLDDEGRLAGMVSIGDLVKHRIDEIEHEAEELRTYVSQAG